MPPARRRRTSSTANKKPERTGLGGGSVDKHLNRPRLRRSNRFVKLSAGETIVVRAVDTSKYFKDGYVHPVEFERKDGSTYTMDVRCLDPDDEGEPCPGCRDDLDRRYKFWLLVIQRDAPKANKAGKIIGEEDQLLMMSGANRLVKALNAKHKRRSLEKRDIEISREGDGFEVQYEVEWADDEDSPLTAADKQLVKEGTDVIEAFERYTTIPDEEDFYEAPQMDSEDEEDVGEKSRRRGSTFDSKRKRKPASDNGDDTEDEDDEEDETPARRPTKGIAAARRSKSTGKTTLKKRRSAR